MVCAGGVCVPAIGFLPILFMLFKRIWDYLNHGFRAVEGTGGGTYKKVHPCYPKSKTHRTGPTACAVTHPHSPCIPGGACPDAPLVGKPDPKCPTCPSAARFLSATAFPNTCMFTGAQSKGCCQGSRAQNKSCCQTTSAQSKSCCQTTTEQSKGCCQAATEQSKGCCQTTTEQSKGCCQTTTEQSIGCCPSCHCCPCCCDPCRCCDCCCDPCRCCDPCCRPCCGPSPHAAHPCAPSHHAAYPYAHSPYGSVPCAPVASAAAAPCALMASYAAAPCVPVASYSAAPCVPVAGYSAAPCVPVASYSAAPCVPVASYSAAPCVPMVASPYAVPSYGTAGYATSGYPVMGGVPCVAGAKYGASTPVRGCPTCGACCPSVYGAGKGMGSRPEYISRPYGSRGDSMFGTYAPGSDKGYPGVVRGVACPGGTCTAGIEETCCVTEVDRACISFTQAALPWTAPDADGRSYNSGSCKAPRTAIADAHAAKLAYAAAVSGCPIVGKAIGGCPAFGQKTYGSCGKTSAASSSVEAPFHHGMGQSSMLGRPLQGFPSGRMIDCKDLREFTRAMAKAAVTPGAKVVAVFTDASVPAGCAFSNYVDTFAHEFPNMTFIKGPAKIQPVAPGKPLVPAIYAYAFEPYTTGWFQVDRCLDYHPALMWLCVSRLQNYKSKA